MKALAVSKCFLCVWWSAERGGYHLPGSRKKRAFSLSWKDRAGWMNEDGTQGKGAKEGRGGRGAARGSRQRSAAGQRDVINIRGTCGCTVC